MAKDKLSIVIKYLTWALQNPTFGTMAQDFHNELAAVKPRTPIIDPVKLNYETWEWEGIGDDLMSFWRRTFPALDIAQELRSAAAWVRANPERRKVRYSPYLFGWMSRSQRKARGQTSLPSAGDRADAWARGSR